MRMCGMVSARSPTWRGLPRLVVDQIVRIKWLIDRNPRELDDIPRNFPEDRPPGVLEAAEAGRAQSPLVLPNCICRNEVFGTHRVFIAGRFRRDRDRGCCRSIDVGGGHPELFKMLGIRPRIGRRRGPNAEECMKVKLQISKPRMRSHCSSASRITPHL